MESALPSSGLPNWSCQASGPLTRVTWYASGSSGPPVLAKTIVLLSGSHTIEPRTSPTVSPTSLMSGKSLEASSPSYRFSTALPTPSTSMGARLKLALNPLSVGAKSATRNVSS